MTNLKRQHWNQQFKILQDTWPKSTNFENCIEICLNLHAMVHSAGVSHSGIWSFEDDLWQGMSDEAFRKVHKGDQSIAWKLWHTGRIEDITMNLLIAGEQQIFKKGDWFDKLNVMAHDTGNAMNEDEIEALSEAIDGQALREYRLEVGKNTQSIIKTLQPEDLKQKIETYRLQRILDEGAVVEESKGLIDYWGKKTFAGLLLMPATRHNLVHLNESIRLLEKRAVK
jgi:hypothetical protein